MKKVAESLLSSEKHSSKDKIALLSQLLNKLPDEKNKQKLIQDCYTFLKSMDDLEIDDRFILAEGLIENLKLYKLVSAEDFNDTVASFKDLSIWALYSSALIKTSQNSNAAKISGGIKATFAKKIGKDASFWLCDILNTYLEYKNRNSLMNRSSQVWQIPPELTKVDFKLLMRRIKIIHEFFMNNPNLIPISIDLREIIMKWIILINVDASPEAKSFVENLCESLLMVCRNEVNNLSIAFRVALNYLRFTYQMIEPLQPLHSLHVFFEKIYPDILEELLQFSIFGQNWNKNEWFEVLKNLFKMGMTKNISVIFLTFSRYLASAKEFDVLIKVCEGIIPKTLSNMIYAQFCEPILDILEFYLIGSPANSEMVLKVKDGLLSHLKQLIQESRLLEADRLNCIINCLLKKHEYDEDLVNDFNSKMNHEQWKVMLSPLDDGNIKTIIEEKNWLSENNFFKIFNKKTSSSKNSGGFRGLSNLGNTCYMNSFLQALFMNKEFRDRVLKMKFELQSEKGENMEIEGPQPKNLDFKTKIKFLEPGCRIQKLFALLFQSTRPFVNPSFFRDIIPEIFRLNFQQHDSSEFGRFFLDSFERALKFSSDKELLNDCFIGESINTIECQVCSNTQFKTEKFLDLHVNFPTSKESFAEELSVNSLIKLSFQNEELKEKNEYFCEKCSKNSPLSIKITKISRVPNTLIITINRFSYDLKIQKKKKLMDFVRIDRILSFEGCTTGDFPGLDQYHLTSIIIHRGTTTEFGHYFCVARESLKEGSNWLVLDDSNVLSVKEDYINNVLEKSSDDTPYILFYQNKLVSDQLRATENPLKLDPILMKFVENDNMQYLKEVQTNMKATKSLANFNLSKPYFGPGQYKKDDDQDNNGFGGSSMGSNNLIF